MKKKLIAAGMTAVMTAGLLAGCGGGSGSEGTTEDGKKKVTVWAWDVEYNIPIMERRQSAMRQSMMMWILRS